MIKKLLTVAVSVVLLGGTGFVYAQGNASAGKGKAAMCAGCHGEDGNSAMPGFPKLAGQHPGYLVKQLQAFKEGRRMAPMMAPLALGLEDADMQDLAAFYASNKISSNPAPVLPADDEDDDAPAKSEEQKKASFRPAYQRVLRVMVHMLKEISLHLIRLCTRSMLIIW